MYRSLLVATLAFVAFDSAGCAQEEIRLELGLPNQSFTAELPDEYWQSGPWIALTNYYTREAAAYELRQVGDVVEVEGGAVSGGPSRFVEFDLEPESIESPGLQVIAEDQIKLLGWSLGLHLETGESFCPEARVDLAHLFEGEDEAATGPPVSVVVADEWVSVPVQIENSTYVETLTIALRVNAAPCRP